MSEHRSPGEDLVSVPEAARRLDVSKPTVYRLIAEGKLLSLTIGRSRKVVNSSIDSLIAHRSTPAVDTTVAAAAAVLIQRTCGEQHLDIEILDPEVLAKVSAVLRSHRTATTEVAS